MAKTPLGKDGRPLSPASAAIARAKAGEDLESLLADPTLNQGPSKLVACPSCGRNFAFDRLEKHLPICQKAKQSAKERGKWDGDARRRTEDAMAAERAATPPPGAYESAVRRRNEKQPGGVARNDAAKRGGGGNRGKTPPSTKGAAGRAVAAAAAAAAGAPGGAAEILVLDEAPAPPPMLRKENSIWREDKGADQAAVAPQLVGARVQAPAPPVSGRDSPSRRSTRTVAADVQVGVRVVEQARHLGLPLLEHVLHVRDADAHAAPPARLRRVARAREGGVELHVSRGSSSQLVGVQEVASARWQTVKVEVGRPERRDRGQRTCGGGREGRVSGSGGGFGRA